MKKLLISACALTAFVALAAFGGAALAPRAHAEGTALSAAELGQAKTLYKKHCKKCHGWDGKGQTTMGKKQGVKDWTVAEWQGAVDDATMLKTIVEGWKDAANPKRAMPAYAERMKPEEMQLMVKTVRAFAAQPGPFADEAAKEK